MDSLIPDLLELMPDTVGVEAPGSESETGVITGYGTLTNRHAHVTGILQQVLGNDGQEHTSKIQATFAGAFGLTVNHRYTLPARFSTNPSDTSDTQARQHKAIAVGHQSDENGAHHEVVYF